MLKLIQKPISNLSNLHVPIYHNLTVLENKYRDGCVPCLSHTMSHGGMPLKILTIHFCSYNEKETLETFVTDETINVEERGKLRENMLDGLKQWQGG